VLFAGTLNAETPMIVTPLSMLTRQYTIPGICESNVRLYILLLSIKEEIYLILYI
jgi:hypothetical protein